MKSSNLSNFLNSKTPGEQKTHAHTRFEQSVKQNIIVFQICNQRRECFDMKDRRDRTVIGTNKTGNGTPVKSYYTCLNGYCTEIYNLTCERKCNETEFDLVGKNSVIFTGEKVITSKCSSILAFGEVSLPSLSSVKLMKKFNEIY